MDGDVMCFGLDSYRCEVHCDKLVIRATNR
jgi:hypothetical protein